MDTKDHGKNKVEKFTQSEKESRKDPFNFRIHNNWGYVHRWSASQLLKQIHEAELMFEQVKDDIIIILDDEDNDLSNDYRSDIEIIKKKIIHIELLFVTYRINCQIFKLHKEERGSFTTEEAEKTAKDLIKNELMHSKAYDTIEAIIESASTLENEIPNFEANLIKAYVDGKKQIWIPAVSWVVRAFFKIAKMTDVNFKYLKKYHEESNFKRLFVLANGLSKIFDFLYISSMDDPNDIFYNPNENDINLLMNCVEFSEPKNLLEHKKMLLDGISHFDYYCAVVAKAFKSTNVFEQVSDFLVWAMYYKDKKQTYLEDGEFAKNWLNKESLTRLLSIIQNEYVQKRLSESTHYSSITVNQELFIPILSADELTIENMDDQCQPIIIEEDLNMKPEVDLYNRDPNGFVKVRLVLKNDYGKFDWKYGNVIDEDWDSEEFDAIIVHVHGGGFITGSSGESQKSLMHYATIDTEIDKGYPIISVDYRLAPTYKFPTGLSDLWQVYWWLTKYAERYLKMKFKKIIMTGDSAGGNLIWGVTNLCIQKNVKKPDGLLLIYPAVLCSLTAFSPSTLFSLDDTFLTASFMYLWYEYYVDEEKTNVKHHLLSPRFTKDENLKEFPPTRFIIAGLDPLRDEQYRLIYRMAKLGVNIKATDFRYLMHTCKLI